MTNVLRHHSYRAVRPPARMARHPEPDDPQAAQGAPEPPRPARRPDRPDTAPPAPNSEAPRPDRSRPGRAIRNLEGNRTMTTLTQSPGTTDFGHAAGQAYPPLALVPDPVNDGDVIDFPGPRRTDQDEADDLAEARARHAASNARLLQAAAANHANPPATEAEARARIGDALAAPVTHLAGHRRPAPRPYLTVVSAADAAGWYDTPGGAA